MGKRGFRAPNMASAEAGVDLLELEAGDLADLAPRVPRRAVAALETHHLRRERGGESAVPHPWRRGRGGAHCFALFHTSSWAATLKGSSSSNRFLASR